MNKIPIATDTPSKIDDLITVTDPIQIQDGINKYTAYHIQILSDQNSSVRTNTEDSLHYFSGAVLRRYSDFVWLVEKFHTEKGGAIVPPLPEKQAVSRFTPTFVAQRAKELQQFLNEVYAHPELQDAECLHTFLKAEDVAFAIAKKQVMDPLHHNRHTSVASHVTNVPQNLSKWLSGMSLSSDNRHHSPSSFNNIATASSSVPFSNLNTQEDMIMLELKNDLKEWENQIKTVLLHSQKLVKKTKEIANGYFEMGLAFTLLGQSESDALGRALTRMGQSNDTMSVLTSDHSEKEFVKYEVPLSYYLKIIHSARTAVKRREEAKDVYYKKVGEINKYQFDIEKYRGRSGKEEKYYQSQTYLSKAQEDSQLLLQEFNIINERVTREIDRFKDQTETSLKSIIKEFVALQVEYYSKVEDVWAHLVSLLEEEDFRRQQQLLSETTASIGPGPSASVETVSEEVAS